MEYLAEQWKTIVGYDDWEVSTHGRVRRVTPARRTQAGSILACPLDINGRRRTNLGDKTMYVNVLVAETFLGPKPIGYEIHHRDGDQSNDWLYNLEYVEISSHRAEHKMKLSAVDVRLIKSRYEEGISPTQIAKEFNVSDGHIGNIVAGRKRTIR